MPVAGTHPTGAILFKILFLLKASQGGNGEHKAHDILFKSVGSLNFKSVNWSLLTIFCGILFQCSVTELTSAHKKCGAPCCIIFHTFP